MTQRSRSLALGVVCTSSLVATLDHSILNVALPTLVHELDASTSDLQWIVDFYILAFAGLLLLGGSLADRFGRRNVLQTGLVIFGTASAFGAWAPSAEFLALCRGVMGLGAALFFPASVTIVTTIFTDPRERGRALGVWSVMGGLGIALGPILGGLLLAAFWWGSVFLVNVPIVIGALVIGRLTIPESRNPDRARFDPLGVILSIAGTVLLVWTTIQAPAHGWASPTTLASFALALAILAAFVLWEMHSDHPTLDIELFHNARFSVANLATATGSFGLAGAMFLLTLLLQSVFGYSALVTGLRLLPLAVAFIVTGVLAPRVAERIGTKLTVALGLIVGIVGLLLLTATDEQTGTAVLSIAMLALGSGSGLTLAPTTDAVVGAAPPGKVGAASGLLGTMRQASAALGVAVLGSILVSGYQGVLDDRASNLKLSNSDLDTARDSLGAALDVARHVDEPTGAALRNAAREAFLHGMHAATLAGIVVLAIGTVFSLRYLPAYAHDVETHDPAVPVPEPVSSSRSSARS